MSKGRGDSILAEFKIISWIQKKHYIFIRFYVHCIFIVMLFDDEGNNVFEKNIILIIYIRHNNGMFGCVAEV